MGNKQGKLEGSAREDSKKKKKSNHSASAHDLTGTHNDHGGGGGNSTSPFVRDFRVNGGRAAGFKRYQSYAGPSSSGSSRQHGGGGNRSSEAKPDLHQNPVSAPTGGRYRSLPRHPGGTSARNRSQSVSSTVYQSNGTLNGEPVDGDGHVTYKRYAHIPASGHHSNDTVRSPATGGLNSTYSGRGSGYRHGSNYRGVADDFPDTASIKRRLVQFETEFTRCFTALYSRLGETVQLDSVPVALCIDGPSTRHQVSLYQYLTSDDVPADLNDDGPYQTGRSPNHRRYVLGVPEALFQDVKRTRSQRVRDRARWVALAKEIAGCVAVEVAEELSRMFEYQIALLGDGPSVDLLAGHAVQSAFEYVKAVNGFVERSTLIAGVLGGGGGLEPAKTVSVFVGGREFKWNLSQVFRMCGLRKEMLLFGPRSRDSTKFVPWTYHESATSSGAQVYGYRGIALDRDPVHGYYVVVREDEIRYAARTVGRCPDDIHTRYCPYRRLIGKEVMDEYCRSTKDTASVSLGEYVSRLQGYEYSRDVVQPVYRPLGMVSGLSKSSRIGTSVSSLLLPSSTTPSTGPATNRVPGGRYEEVERRPRSHFANGEPVPVFVRNISSTSSSQRYNPRTGRSGERGYRSESCSVTSEDLGDEPGVGYGEGEGSAFAPRHDPHQQRRPYQSQRPHSSKSVSNFNPGPGSFNYLKPAGSGTSPIYASVAVNRTPGPGGFDQAQNVNQGPTTSYGRPSKSPDSGFNQTLTRGSTSTSTMVNQSQKPEREIDGSVQPKDREFLDFKAFLGMIEQGENNGVVH